MYDPRQRTDELVEIRHRIYHQPDFVENIDNLLCLQEMEITEAEPAQRRTASPG